MIPRYLLDFDSSAIPKYIRDVVVVGSGIAGLTAALELSKELDVSLIAKSSLDESATKYAQGGVAAAASEADSPALHFNDTIAAGGTLCDRQAVEVLVSEGADWVGELIRLGAEFDWLGDKVRLAREGGHSLPRVLHAGDATGSQIMATLLRVAKRWETLAVFEDEFAVDLATHGGRCVGVLVLGRDGLRLEFAPAIVLATGGAGQLFRITTNPRVSTGDGHAMAYRAGATLIDMEFVQFHPTALAIEEMPYFLITEALRGEGAVLLDGLGRRIMVGAHPSADLAPRDVVTRRIVETLERGEGGGVFLDARHIGSERLASRFPTIYNHCLSHRLDPGSDLIPVVPAAHYMIGGVKTDIHGQSDLPGLYATGEAAATGVHGANRLASNSLLEGLVFSKRIAHHIKKHSEDEELKEELSKAKITGDGYVRSASAFPAAEARADLQALMTEKVGPSRSAGGLEEAIEKIDRMLGVEPVAESPFEGLELTNMLTVACLIATSALERRESRGVHFRSDFPFEDPLWERRIVRNIAGEGSLHARA
ncbi:MAG: L-aspartate oxidase [Candidatus Aquicultorales bacterium]